VHVEANIIDYTYGRSKRKTRTEKRRRKKRLENMKRKRRNISHTQEAVMTSNDERNKRQTFHLKGNPHDAFNMQKDNDCDMMKYVCG
jgi:hypothetical protein